MSKRAPLVCGGSATASRGRRSVLEPVSRGPNRRPGPDSVRAQLAGVSFARCTSCLYDRRERSGFYPLHILVAMPRPYGTAAIDMVVRDRTGRLLGSCSRTRTCRRRASSSALAGHAHARNSPPSPIVNAPGRGRLGDRPPATCPFAAYRRRHRRRAPRLLGETPLRHIAFLQKCMCHLLRNDKSIVNSTVN